MPASKITIYHLLPPRCTSEALEAAFRELEVIENVMSLYRPGSQVCRLNRDGELQDPHGHLVRVLKFAKKISGASNGAFDITVQPLWEAFHAANQRGNLPDDAAVDAAGRKVDWRRVRVSENKVTLDGEGTAITLNGIAQGYAADRVKDVFSHAGIAHALIDCGEISALGRTAQGSPWSVGVQHPREEDAFISIAQISGRCLATSGDYATCFGGEKGDAFRWNHLFDPKTGRSPDRLASVSVAANTAMEADALSTAVFVAGVERGQALIEELPGVDALFVLKNGKTMATKEFPWKV
jgi:thiamine biosynthesis lipoprotein